MPQDSTSLCIFFGSLLALIYLLYGFIIGKSGNMTLPDCLTVAASTYALSLSTNTWYMLFRDEISIKITTIASPIPYDYPEGNIFFSLGCIVFIWFSFVGIIKAFRRLRLPVDEK